MSERLFHTATKRERERLGRTLVAAKVFADMEDLAEALGAEPWHLQVNDRGDVAVLDRWRDHLDVLSIEALWCPSPAISAAMAEFMEVAAEHGMHDLVSPPVPVEETEPYERAGMQVHTSVMTLVRSPLPAEKRAEPQGVSVREAGHADIGTLLAVDTACFEPFWRYDARHFARFLLHGRLAIGEQAGRAVGYTLCTVDGDEALLGRLCVLPASRRQGIGAALLDDAMHYADAYGARRMTLSTQVDNAPSQALYRKEGFRETGRRYAFLRFEQ